MHLSEKTIGQTGKTLNQITRIKKLPVKSFRKNNKTKAQDNVIKQIIRYISSGKYHTSKVENHWHPI